MIIGNPGNLARVLRKSRREPPPAAPAPQFTLIETFDTNPGYDLVWTVIAGTPDPDDLTLPMQGTEALRLDASGGVNQRTDSPTFGPLSELWVYFRFFPEVFHLAGANGIIHLKNNAANIVSLAALPTGEIRIETPSENTGPTVDATSGTPFHMWLHYRAGSGADGFLEFAFSDTGGKPLGGNKYISRADCGQTLPINNIRFESIGGPNAIWVVDFLKVATFNIGDNGNPA